MHNLWKQKFSSNSWLLHLISEWTWTSCITLWALGSSSVKQRWRSKNIHLPSCFVDSRLGPRTWPVLINSWPPASRIFPSFHFHNQSWPSSCISPMDTEAERVRLSSSATAALSVSSLSFSLPVAIKPKTPKISCKHEAVSVSRSSVFFCLFWFGFFSVFFFIQI